MRNMTDLCLFVGETLGLNCNAEDGTPLNIIDPTGRDMGNNFTIVPTYDNINDVNGTHECQLSNIAGPCGAGALQLAVEVFGKFYLLVVSLK